MDANLKSVEPPLVECRICLKEIPESEAVNAEARDYVAYFCGIECYRIWAQQNAPDGGATSEARREAHS